MNGTLNKYIPLLKGKHQDYIVLCVREYGDMPDFHRGLLPFLPAQTAATCLRIRLERIKEGSTGEDKPVGVRFVMGILSRFETSHRIAEGEVSVVMRLLDWRLGAHFYKRYGPKFIVALHGWDKANAVHLEKLDLNKWLVTAANNRMLDVATTFLSENFS